MITSRPLIPTGPDVFRKHLMIGKVILVLLAGVVVGYALGVTSAEDAERGHTLTLEEYIADFDTYRADLQAADLPMAVSITIGVITVAGFFALYEALGLAVGWVVSLILPSSWEDAMVASGEDARGDLPS